MTQNYFTNKQLGNMLSNNFCPRVGNYVVNKYVFTKNIKHVSNYYPHKILYRVNLSRELDLNLKILCKVKNTFE